MRRLAAVIGWPLGYSRSPALHEAAYRALGFDGTYVALPVPPHQLEDAIRGVRALGFLGLNVTSPHKQRVLPLADDIDDSAARVGAANTLVLRDGRLVAHNTDVEGFRRSLGADVDGGKVVVLGSGGAARAVVAGLAGRPLIVVARAPERAAELQALGATGIVSWTPDRLPDALDGADLVVDATSAGLDDAPWPAPLPLDRLPARALVCSLVYHREPSLLRDARALGLRTLDGGAMLVHQAAAAVRLMTGESPPIEPMFAAL